MRMVFMKQSNAHTNPGYSSSLGFRDNSAKCLYRRSRILCRILEKWNKLKTPLEIVKVSLGYIKPMLNSKTGLRFWN